MTQLTERVGMRFTFEVFDLFKTPTFDIPINEVQKSLNFDDFPVYGTSSILPLPSGIGIVNRSCKNQFSFRLLSPMKYILRTLPPSLPIAKSADSSRTFRLA
jgi:hypothetical protein